MVKISFSVNIKVERPIKIYEDNQGCISIANNPSCHKRSKHIDIKYHFAREQDNFKILKSDLIGFFSVFPVSTQ